MEVMKGEEEGGREGRKGGEEGREKRELPGQTREDTPTVGSRWGRDIGQDRTIDTSPTLAQRASPSPTSP